MKAIEGFEFAAHTHWLPVAGVEFYQAARSFPIMFASEGEGANEKVTAILLTGLERGSNDYISEDMKWAPNTYLPAFIRRYPFVLATSQEKTDDFMVCFGFIFPRFQ